MKKFVANFLILILGSEVLKTAGDYKECLVGGRRRMVCGNCSDSDDGDDIPPQSEDATVSILLIISVCSVPCGLA